ncbi:MAG: dockerin type I repeat-containing protein, partial [Clostridia bacterium]|nr:dockerin type I repeat-containing protein [Clostridia bacterium]
DYGVWVGDRDENGELDLEDYRIFLEEWYWNFVYMYDSRAAELSNFVEVTMAADGSITLSDEGAMEFQMVSAGIHGGQEYFEEDFEYYEIKDTERIRAAWVPNAWIGYDGMLGSYSEGHFVTQERTSGDGDFPGITDMKNWKISFREDGSACLVDSWTDYDDTAALQFVKYVNENDEADMTIVGLSEYEWEYSAIMSARTELLPVYLYASEAVFVTPPHDCVWGRWTEDENDSHTRRCTVEGCRKTETEPHEWDGGKVTEAPTCTENGTTTYICFTCGATKTESIDELGHDWGDWTYDGADYHVRICERTDCTEKDYGSHKWSDWSSTGSREHKAVCSECNHEHTDTHSWDDGVEIKPATVTDEGTKKFLCTDCGATKTEVIPKIVCDHSFGKWTADDDETHTRVCINGTGCKAYERQPHRWNEGTVTVGATETAEGLMTYICLGCGYERTEKIPMLQHTHRFGDWVSNGDGTHSCYCENGVCTAVETAEHSCELWEDNEDGATHSGACVYCDEKLTETHDWSDWAVGVTEDQLVRNCHCGAFEEMDIHQTIGDAVTNLTPVDNGAGAELVIENTLDLFNDVLTDAEQNAVAGGDATVSIYLDVTDVPVNEVSASDKAAAAAAIEDEDNGLDEESEIGMYLDINLFKEVTTNEEGTTETDTSKISETPGKVTITIKIPQELINADRSVERIYRIIRIHQSADGSIITDVIEGKYDPENQTFTFETDKFSTYAVVYSDVEPSAVPGDLNDDGKINAKDAVLLAQYLANWDVEINLVAADCKKDGVISAKDAVLLAQYLANWSVTLG